jgi:hypothetical protein
VQEQAILKRLIQMECICLVKQKIILYKTKNTNFGFDEVRFLYCVSNGILSRNLDDIINVAGGKRFMFDTKRKCSLKRKNQP